MRAFVPMSIARGVERAIDEEGGDRPPAAPGEDRPETPLATSNATQGAEIGEPGRIAALHQPSQVFAWDLTAVPAFPGALWQAIAEQGDGLLEPSSAAMGALPVSGTVLRGGTPLKVIGVTLKFPAKPVNLAGQCQVEPPRCRATE